MNGAATNTAAAQLIAKHLHTGLPHPGNGKDQPPTLIPMPGFRTTGLPDDMRDTVNKVAQHLGEALINLLHTEGNYRLVDATEDQPMTADIAGINHAIIRCNKCKAMLAVIDANLNVDARTFIPAVGSLNPDCTTGHKPT